MTEHPFQPSEVNVGHWYTFFTVHTEVNKQYICLFCELLRFA